ncbi:acyltransferase family protein [Glycomyces paridis]|uniref:Acyltransferase n=1 Tax=Glycomyces paridis TaxID=2126555 RepID=A0A4S8PCI3_9ACTN|nr:acyltransferase family protein [Glycomyces paridis]THV28028.1 acyltransferase [Glycomyces paridis]
MTSPQPPRPQNRTTAGAVNEETLHLPLTTPGPAVPMGPPPAAAPGPFPPRTAPNPYPPRPAFRAPAPPPPAAPVPAKAPRRPLERWEGVGFRPDIQGLRAVAVLLVLLSHAGFGFFAGGYVGVDVFFVLSGFLITSLLVKEVFDTGKVSIAGFYARRARRILPAASLVTVATIAGAWLWFPITRLEAVMQDAFTVIVYVVNYRLIAQESEYLNADQMPSPFQQYWSLAVEEQFYLVWPLLLLGLLLLVKKDPRRLVAAGAALAAAVLVISLVASVFVTEQAPTAAYYGAHTRAWELAAGALLALSLPVLKRTPKYLAWVLGIVGLAAIVGAGVLYSEATPFPGYTAILPVVGTMLVITAGSAPGATPAARLLGTGPFQFVGRISYSLYLWHWPVLILVPLAVDAEPSIALNVVLILGSFALAQLSYRYVEQPVRTAKPFKSGKVWGLVVGVVCSVVSVAVVVAAVTTGPVAGDADDDDPPVEAIEEVSAMELALTEGLTLETVPEDVVEVLGGIQDDRGGVFDNGCLLPFDATEPADDCVFGDTDADTTVVLMGDSHAAQWFPAVEAIALEAGWRLVVHTKGSCPVASVTVDNDAVDGRYGECDDWRAAVLDEIDELEPAMVIVSSSLSYDLRGVDEGGSEEWAAGWSRAARRLVAASPNVVALTDTPRAPFDAADCLALHLEEATECVFPSEPAMLDLDWREAEADAWEREGIASVDTTGWFCIDGSCPAVVSDTLVYRDSNHITHQYMAVLQPLLAEALPRP